VLKVVHEESEPNEHTPAAVGGSLLDGIVRDGARQILATALQAEVAAYIDAFADQVDADGHRLVVRNGFHQPREVTTAAGAVPVATVRLRQRVTRGPGSRAAGVAMALAQTPPHARPRSRPASGCRELRRPTVGSAPFDAELERAGDRPSLPTTLPVSGECSDFRVSPREASKIMVRDRSSRGIFTVRIGRSSKII
jgi:hypothetical protein